MSELLCHLIWLTPGARDEEIEKDLGSELIELIPGPGSDEKRNPFGV